MFFFLSKILIFLIMPLVWIIALMLSAVFSRNRLKRERRIAVSLLLLLFFSNSFIFNEVMRQWEVPLTPVADIKNYDVAIVLGGLFGYNDKFQRIGFKRESDRFLQAVELYKLGKVKKLLISGGSAYMTEPEAKEAPRLKKFLLKIGIPEKDIWIESESRNTHENAIYTARLLREKGFEGRLLLCTSGFHLRRAVDCFENEGISVDTYSTDMYSSGRSFSIANLIPSSAVLTSWSLLIHEIVGFITYKIVGYA